MKPLAIEYSIDGSIAYHKLSVAQQLYDCSAAELDQQQLQRVEKVVERKYALEKLVLTSDKAVGISVPAQDIDSALENVLQRYPDPQEFDIELAEHGLDRDSYTVALTRELWVDAVLEHVGCEVQDVDDVEAQLYYYMHPEQFNKPETRTARHILITVNDQLEGNSRAEAYQKIIAVERRLNKKIGRFQEQASKHSECPTALNGGLLGEIKKGILYPQLEQVLFQLPEGRLSPIVESELGYHLLLCDCIHPAGLMPLNQVRDKLKGYLRQQRRKEYQKQWLASLHQDSRL